MTDQKQNKKITKQKEKLSHKLEERAWRSILSDSEGVVTEDLKMLQNSFWEFRLNSNYSKI